jgi:hypothetical protein
MNMNKINWINLGKVFKMPQSSNKISISKVHLLFESPIFPHPIHIKKSLKPMPLAVIRNRSVNAHTYLNLKLYEAPIEEWTYMQYCTK